jgi:hypothetical protein
MGTDGQPDRRTGMTKLRVAFRNFVNAPKKLYYHDFLPLNEKLSDQSNKNIVFSAKVSHGWQNFINFMNTSQNTGKFKFTRLRILTVDIRAPGGFTILKSFMVFVHVLLFLILGLQDTGIGLL